MEDKLFIPLEDKKPEETITRNFDDQNNLSSDSPNVDLEKKDDSNSIPSPPKESDENMNASESKLENGLNNHQDVVMADESEVTASNIIISEPRNEQNSSVIVMEKSEASVYDCGGEVEQKIRSNAIKESLLGRGANG